MVLSRCVSPRVDLSLVSTHTRTHSRTHLLRRGNPSPRSSSTSSRPPRAAGNFERVVSGLLSADRGETTCLCRARVSLREQRNVAFLRLKLGILCQFIPGEDSNWIPIIIRYIVYVVVTYYVNLSQCDDVPRSCIISTDG